MKKVVLDLVSRRIAGVAYTCGDAEPRFQLFLNFSDGTYFELFSNEAITWAEELGDGGFDEVMDSVDGRVIFSHHVDSRECGDACRTHNEHAHQGLHQLLGKSIAGVVATGRSANITSTLRLVFSDGTHFSFHSVEDELECTGGFDRGNLMDALRVASRGHPKVVYSNPPIRE